MDAPSRPDHWPDISYAGWRETAATLQLWSQIVGKVRLARTPWLNHGWHVTLAVSPRGLTTGLIPDPSGGFDLELDFIDQRLVVRTAAGGIASVPLRPQSVASFYEAVGEALNSVGIDVRIGTRPNEIADAVPFPEDRRPRAYDGAAAERFWRALLQCDRVFKLFRTRFTGKSSPVHFFWGSFDLAVTRFSGRIAPDHPGGVPALPDEIAREAYSQEVSSAGFWPGGGAIDYPAFYSYAYPAPDGFRDAPVAPAAAFFHDGLGEFVLPYDAVRTAPSPDQALLDFLQSTYEAAADRAGWPRAALEGPTGALGRPGTP